MQRFLLALVLIVMFAVTAWSQDTGTDTTETEETNTEIDEQDDEDNKDEEDDSDLDDQSYVDGDEDDFRPSEDIPADQSIPFPTDI